ncbi:MAG TPA: DUF4337 family protein [Verrucomicrobiae bacterium]
MKVTIPQELKADMPQTAFGKVLTATPVVMAVVATMLAGLASSEMTRAQYDRALAAQQQSKAGDQWSFFQAKRLRGAIQRNTADLMQATVEVPPLDPAALRSAAEQASAPASADSAKLKTELLAALESPAGQQALGLMKKGELPPGGTTVAPPPEVKAALDAMENLRSDQEIAVLLADVTLAVLDETVAVARDRALDFDAATRPVNQAIDQLDSLISRQAAVAGLANAAVATATRQFTAARLRYAAARYEVEARLNQAIANLYELQVRKSNLSAERHHRRSQQFFFGMLGAQAGVIISTFAMAARQRNVLWALAAAAGLVAVAFAIYVYLCM